MQITPRTRSRTERCSIYDVRCTVRSCVATARRSDGVEMSFHFSFHTAPCCQCWAPHRQSLELFASGMSDSVAVDAFYEERSAER